jgi:general secretion pathway protein M
MSAALMQWLAGRSPRERAMLGVLAALALGLGLWFGVVAPLAAAQRAAAEKLDKAVRVERAVEGALSELAAVQRRVKPPASHAPVDEAVSRSAEAAGLVLGRVEADPSGGVQATLQGASANALFPWLVALQREHGVVASHLTILKGEGGGLDVDATFVRAGG